MQTYKREQKKKFRNDPIEPFKPTSYLNQESQEGYGDCRDRFSFHSFEEDSSSDWFLTINRFAVRDILSNSKNEEKMQNLREKELQLERKLRQEKQLQMQREKEMELKEKIDREKQNLDLDKKNMEKKTKKKPVLNFKNALMKPVQKQRIKKKNYVLNQNKHLKTQNKRKPTGQADGEKLEFQHKMQPRNFKQVTFARTHRQLQDSFGRRNKLVDKITPDLNSTTIRLFGYSAKHIESLEQGIYAFDNELEVEEISLYTLRRGNNYIKGLTVYLKFGNMTSEFKRQVEEISIKHGLKVTFLDYYPQ